MAQDDWTDEELRGAVDAYREMLQHQLAGEAFVKKDYYRELSKRFGRTEKAFEYRAQNISHVLALLGRDWLPGLGSPDATLEVEADLPVAPFAHVVSGVRRS